MLVGPLLYWLMLDAPLRLRELRVEERLPHMDRACVQFAVVDGTSELTQSSRSDVRFFTAPAAAWHGILRERLAGWRGRHAVLHSESCAYTREPYQSNTSRLPTSIWPHWTLPPHSSLLGIVENQSSDEDSLPVLRYLLLTHRAEQQPMPIRDSERIDVQHPDATLHTSAAGTPSTLPTAPSHSPPALPSLDMRSTVPSYAATSMSLRGQKPPTATSSWSTRAMVQAAALGIPPGHLAPHLPPANHTAGRASSIVLSSALSSSTAPSSADSWWLALSAYLLISSTQEVELSLTLFSYAVEQHRLQSYQVRPAPHFSPSRSSRPPPSSLTLLGVCAVVCEQDTPFGVSAVCPDLNERISFASATAWVNYQLLMACIRMVPSVRDMRSWAEQRPAVLQEKLDELHVLVGPLLYWLMTEGRLRLRELRVKERLVHEDSVCLQFAVLDGGVEPGSCLAGRLRYFTAPASAWHGILRERLPGWRERHASMEDISGFYTADRNRSTCDPQGLPPSMWPHSTLPPDSSLVGVVEDQSRGADVEPVLRYLFLTRGAALPRGDAYSVRLDVQHVDAILHGPNARAVLMERSGGADAAGRDERKQD